MLIIFILSFLLYQVHRNIPDPGPDPRHRRISHFGHDLEDNYPVR